MRITRVLRSVAMLAAVTLSLLALPATATSNPGVPAPVSAALPPAVTGVVHPLADYLQRGFSPRDALLLRQLDSLVAAGVPASLVQPQVTRERSANPLLCGWRLVIAFGVLGVSDIQGAGDLDGDGRTDVIESRGSMLSKTTSGWSVTARDARTGRALWAHRYVLPAGEFLLAMPFKGGPDGRPGVLEMRYGYRDVRDVTYLSTVVTVVDGHGQRLWSRSFSGTITWKVDFNVGFIITYDHAPVSIVPAQLQRGAQDVLVTIADAAPGGSTSSVLRLAGVGGAVSHPVSNVAGEIGLAPDQDGDGYADLWAATLRSPSAFAAHKATTGKRLWVNTTLALSDAVWVEDAGVVVTKSGNKHDLAVATRSAVPGAPTVGSPVGGPAVAANPQLNSIALVTGGTGVTAWQKPGTDFYALHRAGSPRKAALGVSTFGEVQAAMAVELVEAIVTYDGAGQPITEQRYSFEQAPSECGAGAAIALPWEGDVDVDGALEGQVAFFVFDDNGFYSDTLLIRGSDGAVLYHPTSWSLGGSLDGQGTDRYSDVGAAGKVTMTARRGETQKPIWSRSLPVAGKGYIVDAYALPITATRCLDVAVVVYGSGGTTSALLASSGQPWWTVSYSGPKDIKGRLSRGRVTSVLC